MKSFVQLSLIFSGLLNGACGSYLGHGSGTKIINAAPPGGVDNYPEIYMIRHGGHTCSGTLITPNVVLTAAHCVFEGTRRVYRVDVETQEGVFKSDTFAFKDFNPDELEAVKRHRHDLALVRLPKSIQIKPRPRAEQSPQVKDQLVIVGYGQTGMTSFGSAGGIKRTGNNSVGKLQDNYIYFDGLAATDLSRPGVLSSAYRGDSGGPVINANGQIMGVISWGTTGDAFEKDGETMTTSVAVDITTEESKGFINTTLEKIKDPKYRECFICW